MSKCNVVFSDEAKTAIVSTVDYVAQDAYQLEGPVTKEMLIELALDAGRMEKKFKKADKEISDLINAYGWKKVLSAAIKLI